MRKEIEWLKDEIKVFQKGENMFTAEFNAGVQQALEYVQELIDQLDEPEVKQPDKKIRELESYNDELIRDNNQLRNALDNQEVLSQEWIDEHAQGGCDEWVYIEDLQNLLVPKQNKPIIPQFVADWIESQDDPIYEMCVNYEMWGVNGDDGTTRFTGEIAEWFDDTLNVENYYRACIDGYEVEKEKRYYIINKENNATLMTFELSDVVGEEIIEFVDTYSENETVHFDSKEKAELIAHFVGDFVEVEEVKE